MTKTKDVTSDHSSKKKRATFAETNLAAVEVNKPHVVWYFKLGFVEEETGWDTNNVGSGSEKQLKKTYQSGKKVRLQRGAFPVMVCQSPVQQRPCRLAVRG